MGWIRAGIGYGYLLCSRLPSNETTCHGQAEEAGHYVSHYGHRTKQNPYTLVMYRRASQALACATGESGFHFTSPPSKTYTWYLTQAVQVCRNTVHRLEMTARVSSTAIAVRDLNTLETLPQGHTCCQR